MASSLELVVDFDKDGALAKTVWISVISWSTVIFWVTGGSETVVLTVKPQVVMVVQDVNVTSDGMGGSNGYGVGEVAGIILLARPSGGRVITVVIVVVELTVTLPIVMVKAGNVSTTVHVVSFTDVSVKIVVDI